MSVKQLTALFHHRYHYLWFHTQPIFQCILVCSTNNILRILVKPSPALKALSYGQLGLAYDHELLKAKVSEGSPTLCIGEHTVSIINGHKSHSSGGGSNGPEAVEDPSCANRLNCSWRDFLFLHDAPTPLHFIRSWFQHI